MTTHEIAYRRSLDYVGDIRVENEALETFRSRLPKLETVEDLADFIALDTAMKDAKERRKAWNSSLQDREKLWEQFKEILEPAILSVLHAEGKRTRSGNLSLKTPMGQVSTRKGTEDRVVIEDAESVIARVAKAAGGMDEAVSKGLIRMEPKLTGPGKNYVEALLKAGKEVEGAKLEAGRETVLVVKPMHKGFPDSVPLPRHDEDVPAGALSSAAREEFDL